MVCSVTLPRRAGAIVLTSWLVVMSITNTVLLLPVT